LSAAAHERRGIESVRVHRSAIVRLDAVDVLHKGAGGDYEVQLKNGTRLRVSRSRREELERRLGR
jgi:two-component system LytT family response regulator